MDLEEVKTFLRVDGDDEDGLISGLILAAEDYLGGAGIKESAKGDLYEVTVKMLIALFYEHRDTVVDQVTIPPVINNFITQLAARSLEVETS